MMSYKYIILIALAHCQELFGFGVLSSPIEKASEVSKTLLHCNGIIIHIHTIVYTLVALSL